MKNKEIIMSGIITARILNVRDKAGKDGSVIGQLLSGSSIDILELTENNWYRFQYKDKDAYVSSKYVSFHRGRVTARVLNVRSDAVGSSKIVGKLRRNDIVEIVMTLPKWYKIRYKTDYSFVSAKFIDRSIKSKPAEKQKNRNFLKDKPKLKNIKLEPSKTIVVPSSRGARTTAKIYNNFGGLLDVLSKEIKIDIATAIAVLAVESGGNGYGKSGKVLIRFENHLFNRFFGKTNQDIYDEHFKYSPRQQWKSHLFRKKISDKWITFHGNQEKEWEVLTFARSLDNDAALRSASYGAPQILGTNFKRIGYKSVEEMLNNFEKNIRFHIFGLFDFFNPKMIKHLQNNEFEGFAKYYNGRGQAKKYGKYIETHYKTFKKLTSDN